MTFHTLLRSPHWLAFAALLLTGLTVVHWGTSPRASAPISHLPMEMLWAWERPEDLRFIDPGQTGVAFLAGTVFLHGESVTVRPRLQPLRIPPGTALLAVVRIEPDSNSRAVPTTDQRRLASSAIARLANRPGIIAVQVDFDAPASHRAFYRELLRGLRAELPNEMPLSITALASWCLGDNWLDGLPIDEAVPMLFQMGPDNAAVRLHLIQGRDFTAPQCRGSLGLAVNEPVKNLPSGRRRYWFHSRAWTASTARATLDGAQP